MLEKLSDEFKLKSALGEPQTIVHLAHHVQEQYYTPATRDFHNQGRTKAAETIAALIDPLQEHGIPTHATALANSGLDFATLEELGMHPALRNKAAHAASGYASSAFRDNTTGLGKHENCSTLILTGYNTAMCLKDTAIDALDRGYTVIIPVDATDNATNNMKDKQQVLDDLRNRGAILCNAADVLDNLPRRTATKQLTL